MALLLVLTGCATIAHGTHETIAFDSTPDGANVKLKCEKVTREVVTPAKIEIPRNATECIATISKSGFRTSTVTLDRIPTKSYWLNFIGLGAIPFGLSDNSPIDIGGDAGLALLLSSAVGFAVDSFDGAMFEHTPHEVRVTLQRE